MEELLGNWKIHSIDGRSLTKYEMIDIGECYGHCQGQMNFAIEPAPGDMVGCTGSHYRKVEMFKRKRMYIQNVPRKSPKMIYLA